jgi:hypothetical protein
MFKNLLFIGLILGFCIPLCAQQKNWNPFDLRNRTYQWVDSVRLSMESSNTIDFLIELEADVVYIKSKTESNVESQTVFQVVQSIEPEEIENPFTINRSKEDDFEWEAMANLSKIERNDADLLFVVIILLSVIAGALVALYRTFILQVFKSLTKWNYLKILYRSADAQSYSRITAFYILFFASAGLFLYLILDFLNLSYWEEGFLLLFFCIVLVALIYIIKHVTLKFIGWVFQIDRSLDQYSFTISVFNVGLGLILIPFSAFIAFGPESLKHYFIYCALFFISIALVWRQIRMLIFALNKVIPFAFHFFIYLCAVEIAPVLLLLSIFKLAI